ncbi:MAG TPA: Phenylacetic acid catabolic protein [Methylomirabilota bacterium]|nr:Phenylacetic acid catabolic protein [Methylomirabilota bacterium]
MDETRRAYAAVGITVDQPAAYGTYYRLRCAACGANVGNVGDRLLPGMAEALVAAQSGLYAAGLLGCACGHQRATATAGGAKPIDANGAAATPRPAADAWPFWKRVYAAGDPLPRFERAAAPARRFEEGDALPPEYRDLLLKMLRHEGERAGNKSFLGFMATCLDVAETLYPTAAARLIKAEYLAEELKHAIMFHRLAVGLDPDFACKDVPYAHYTFHLPRESWADDALFHFLVDLNGAFHARDWRDSSYAPLAEMSATVERDELGHSEMGYRFLGEIASEGRGRALVQRLLAKWYPAALDMFGRSDSKNAPKFIGWGLKSVGNAEIRAAYKTYVDTKLVALGLDPPDERANRRFL